MTKGITPLAIIATSLSLGLMSCNGFISDSHSGSGLAASYLLAESHGNIPVVCSAVVDYSAVNEYVQAHYHTAYFDVHRTERQFYDGRALTSNYASERKALNDNGLAVINSPLRDEINWTKLEDVERCYIPYLKQIIHSLFNNVKGYCFWNPMMRGESYSISRPEGEATPTANVAPMVHIDTDIGAFDVADFLDIVDKNAVYQYTVEDSYSFRQTAQNDIMSNKRFVILNFWRNIGAQPVSSSPLAILSTRYNNPNKAFPDVSPSDDSKWYVFSDVTRDEVVVFYQYDRNVMQVSDLFHCAISNGDKVGEGRKSFDIRALILLDEDVPEEADRYRKGRTRPVLSFQESGSFCHEQEQANKRTKS